MRRLLRWIFNFSAVVSAVLLVGVCVLWARSDSICDHFRRCSTRWEIGADSTDGHLCVSAVDWTAPIPDALRNAKAAYERLPRRAWQTALGAWRGPGVRFNGQFLGFGLFVVGGGVIDSAPVGAAGVRTMTVPEYGLAVPDWFAVLLLGALPAARVAAFVRRRRRRKAPGCCPSCGYDLRATPGRCPECGAVPKRP